MHPAIAFAARAELAAGNLDAANTLADELLAVWAERGMRPQQEAVDGSWVLTALDRTAELEAAIDRAVAETPWHEAARRIASGELAGAADVYAEIGTVPDEVYARLKAAEAFVAAGDRPGADRQLGLALPVFAQLGATGWAAEGEALLAASA
jgi:hypothetical protein